MIFNFFITARAFLVYKPMIAILAFDITEFLPFTRAEKETTTPRTILHR